MCELYFTFAWTVWWWYVVHFFMRVWFFPALPFIIIIKHWVVRTSQVLLWRSHWPGWTWPPFAFTTVVSGVGWQINRTPNSLCLLPRGCAAPYHLEGNIFRKIPFEDCSKCFLLQSIFPFRSLAWHMETNMSYAFLLNNSSIFGVWNSEL